MTNPEIQVKVDNRIIESIRPLAEMAQQVKMSNTHIVLRDQYDKKGLSTVISIYDGIKPAHLILDEIYAWAEKNSPEVKALIEKSESEPL